MIVALMLGRKGSTGFPGKNTMNILGRPLMEYPLLAAKNSKYIDKIFVSTDCDKIKEISKKNDVHVIDRPDYLCTKEALGEDAYKHGYEYIKALNPNEEIELVVLLFCNSATISSAQIDEGIEMLKKDSEADSVVTVSKFNMWSPLRARKENSDGYLDPFVNFEYFGDPKTLNCDRDSQGDVLYADMGVSIVRPYCIEKLEEGLLPQKWMGQKILPLRQEFGCDIDYEWQVPMVEYWIKKYSPELIC